LWTVPCRLGITHLVIETSSVSRLLLHYAITDPAIHRGSPHSEGSSHNNLRISRILKCLSEIGLERLNAGFLLHVLNEQSESEELDSWGIRGSMDKWWANCIRDEEERLWIGDLVRKVRSADDGYAFTRQEYKKALEHRAKTGKLGIPQDLPEHPPINEKEEKSEQEESMERKDEILASKGEEEVSVPKRHASEEQKMEEISKQD